MKTFLLLLSLVPCLVLAQTPKSNKQKQSEKFLQTLQIPQHSTLRTTTAILRDSMYTYRNEESNLIEKAYFSYDQQGRLIEEVALWDYNMTGHWSDTKTVFVYSDGVDKSTEIQHYVMKNGKWEMMVKEIQVYNGNNSGMPVSETEYAFIDGVWVEISIITATKFDEEDIPTEYMLTILGDETPILMKWEITINDNYLPAGKTTFSWGDNNTWIPFEKIILSYDKQGLLKIKEEHADYSNGNWEPSYDIHFEYDERGNLISEKEMYADGFVYDSLRYQNYYSDGIATKNESISITSPITIQNYAGSLTIDLGEETNGTVVIIDSGGRTVLNRPLKSEIATIPVHSLAKGIYFIHIKTSRHQVTQKTIIR